MTVITPAGTVRSERGLSSLDYIGLVIIAALMLGGIMLALGGPGVPEIKQALCRAVRDITQSTDSCAPATPPTNPGDSRVPGACKLTEKGEKTSSQISIGIIKIGENAGFIETRYSDGSIKLTATDGGSVGLTAGVGGDVKVGEMLQASRKVNFGGGLEFENGETWTFKGKDAAESEAMAQAMRKQIDDYLFYQYQLTHPACSPYAPVCMPNPFLKKVDKPMSDKTEVTTKTGGKFEVTADASVKDNIPAIPKLPPPGGGATAVPDPNKPGASLMNLGGIVVKGGLNVAYVERYNKETKETTRTEETKLTGSLNGNILQANVGGRYVTGQTISQKRNEQGQLVEFTITSTLEGGWNGSLKQSSKDGKGTSGSVGASVDPTKATVTTTTLKLNPNDPDYKNQVKIIEDWYNGSPDSEYAGIITAEDISPTTRVAGDPLQNLLYDRATTSAIQYENVTNKQEFALNVKIGLAFGFEASLENSTSKAVAADYLAPPGADGTRDYVPFKDCVK